MGIELADSKLTYTGLIESREYIKTREAGGIVEPRLFSAREVLLASDATPPEEDVDVIERGYRTTWKKEPELNARWDRFETVDMILAIPGIAGTFALLATAPVFIAQSLIGVALAAQILDALLIGGACGVGISLVAMLIHRFWRPPKLQPAVKTEYFERKVN